MSQASLQQMVELKDAGDFILLDTILGQQDRFGNIHSEMAFYYPAQNKAGEFKLKSEKDPKDVPAEAQAKVMAVKEMILKDNDCGVAKDGLVKPGQASRPGGAYGSLHLRQLDGIRQSRRTARE